MRGYEYGYSFSFGKKVSNEPSISVLPALVQTVDQAVLVFGVAASSPGFAADAVVAGLAAEEAAHGGHVLRAGGEEDDEHVLWNNSQHDILIFLYRLRRTGAGSQLPIQNTGYDVHVRQA